MIARLNWGAARLAEVVRGLIETIGIEVRRLHDPDILLTPERIPFKPHACVEAKLRLPEILTLGDLGVDATHTIEVKRLEPASAVSILDLDKWFIPEAEECEIKFALAGLKETADKVRIRVTDRRRLFGDPAGNADVPCFEGDAATPDHQSAAEKAKLRDLAETVVIWVHAHRLIRKDQKPTELDTPFVAVEAGSACAWFKPSRIGGDGYRVSARVTLTKDGAAGAVPNLEALETRCPVAPIAHSAKLRVWRRPSFRGFPMWRNGGGVIDGAKIGQMRDYCKVAHVYFVHEGGARQDFTPADIDAGDFKKVAAHSLAGFGGWWGTEANSQKDAEYPYPFKHHGHTGHDCSENVADYWQFSVNAMSMWTGYNGAIKHLLAELAERQG